MRSRRNFCAVILIAAAVSISFVSGAMAQDRRWVHVDDGAGIDLGDGITPVKSLIYGSKGLLPGEFIAAVIHIDERLESDPANPQYGIALVSRIDVQNTWPEKSFERFLDFGFCDNSDGDCSDYRWVSETIGVMSRAAHTRYYKGRILTATSACFESMEALDRQVQGETCQRGTVKALATVAIIYLDKFHDYWRSRDPAPQSLAMRLRDADGAFTYATFSLDGLQDHIEEYLEPR